MPNENSEVNGNGRQSVKKRFPRVAVIVLIVLAAAAAAALIFKDRLGTQVAEMGGPSQQIETKGEDAARSASVRGPVKQPSVKTAPSAVKRPDPGAPVAKAPHGAEPQKRKSEESIIPPWKLPAEQKALSSEEVEREIRYLDAFIDKHGQNSDAYYSRGCLYARRGDLEIAEKDFTQAIEINNRNSDAYYNRGLLMARMEKFDAAVKDFEQAISLNPHAVDAYCNRGNVYFRMGKNDLAMKDFAKALEMKPNDPDIYYNRGLLHLAQGRKAEARADFNKAVALRDHPPSESSGKKPGPPAQPAK